MPNDARSKLRSMGGIMSSYPELMQTAQRFQVGGAVSSGPSPRPFIPNVTQPPMPKIGPRNPGYDPKILRSGTIDPELYGTRRIAPTSPDQARKNAILERAAGRSPTYGSGAQPFPTTPSMPFEPRVPAGPESGLSERAIDRILANLRAGEVSSLQQEEITIDDLLDISIARGIPVEELVEMMPEGVGNVDGPLGSSRRRGSVSRLASRPDISSYTEEDVASTRRGPRPSEATPPSSDELRQEAESLRERASQIRQRRGSEATRDRLLSEADRLESQARVDTTDDARAARGFGRIGDIVQRAAPDPEKVREVAPKIEEVLDKTDTTDDADNDNGSDRPSKRDLRSRYEEKIELFKEIYGTDDKDVAQERAMNLAMIGLAIAAGQSPDALTNIAQGAMAGLQGMGQRRDAERERERGLKTLALQTAIDQQSAEGEAAAEAAKMDLEQQNRLELEEYKARVGAMYGGASGSGDARNIIDFAQNTYNEALKSASAMTAPDFDPDAETPHQYAMRQAQAAAGGISRMFPGYGGGAAEGVPAAPDIPTITTREEYDALPSGAQFMQNGEMRVKR